MMTNTRNQNIAAILEIVAGLSRDITSVGTRPFGDHRLSPRHIDALFVLAHSSSPVTADALARSLRTTTEEVARVVTELRNLGLADDSAAPPRAGVRVITLTAHARADVDAFELAALHRLAPRFSALQDQELAHVVGLLAKVDVQRPAD